MLMTFQKVEERPSSSSSSLSPHPRITQARLLLQPMILYSMICVCTYVCRITTTNQPDHETF